MLKDIIKEQLQEASKEPTPTNNIDSVLRIPLYKPLVQAGILDYISGRGALHPPTPVTLEGYTFTPNPVTLQDLEMIEKIPYIDLIEKIVYNLGGLTSTVATDLHTRYKLTKPNSTLQEPIAPHEFNNLFTNPGNVLYLKSHYLSNVLYNFFSFGS